MYGFLRKFFEEPYTLLLWLSNHLYHTVSEFPHLFQFSWVLMLLGNFSEGIHSLILCAHIHSTVHCHIWWIYFYFCTTGKSDCWNFLRIFQQIIKQLFNEKICGFFWWFVDLLSPVSLFLASVTDYGHPERASFQKSQTFGLGQTNWAEIFWGIWGIFGQTISTIWALWVPCQWENVSGCFSYKKTLVFRPKTYKSQINPKYDIGRKEFGK